MSEKKVILNSLNLDDIFSSSNSSSSGQDNSQEAFSPVESNSSKNIEKQDLEPAGSKSADSSISESFNVNSKELKTDERSIASEEINKRIDNFSDDSLMARLQDIFPSSEEASLCSSLINPDSRGFRAYFTGSMTGTKGIALKKLNKLLFDIGKINKEKYVHIAFNELDKLEKWDTQTLYVVSNLSDAFIKLFSKDLNEEQDDESAEYERMLEFLLNAPLNCYIILDSSDLVSRTNFLNVDPRIGYIFSKHIFFEDYSDEKIADDLIKKLNGKVYVPEKKEIITFLDSNRRFYPFKNEELTNYLALNFEDTGKLPPNKEDSFDLEGSLSGLIGMEDAKNVLRRFEKYLRARKLFEEAGVDLSKSKFSLHLAMMGPPGSGKCFSINERILTPSGWIRNGDLHIGDKIYDHEGNIVTVKGIFPNGKKQLYTLTFDDGTQISSTLDHLWLVQDSIDRNKNYRNNPRFPSFKVLSTENLLKSGITYKRNDGALMHKYSVPLTSPVEFCEKELPINPYLIGCLLGSGSFSQHFPRLPITSQEVMQNLNNIKTIKLSKHIRDVSNPSTGHTYNIMPFSQDSFDFLKALSELGLYKITKKEKFIPDIYKFSSLDQRKQLFKGFVDTNGYITDNMIILRVKSSTLSTDLLELARSLGARAVVRSDGSISVSFQQKPTWATSVESKLKKILSYKDRNNTLVKYITSIEPSIEDDVQCISVHNDTILHHKGDLVDHYLLKFSSGREIVLAEDEHIEVQDILDRRESFHSSSERREQSFKLLTPQEIMSLPLSLDKRNISKLLTRDTFAPFTNPGQVHPYVLGVLLGDGSIKYNTPTITTHDNDIEIIKTVEQFLPNCYKLSKTKRDPSSCPQYSIIQKNKDDTNNKSFSTAYLKPLGLSGTTSATKFIPESYLKAPLADRIWLLRGLMDTDGTTDGPNAFYSTISSTLANDVKELAISLGASATITTKKLYTGNTAHCITMNFPYDYAFTEYLDDNGNTAINSNVFNLKRKAEKYKPVRTLNNFKDFLISIEPIGKRTLEYDVGVKQNNTYIAGDYIASHNTTLARIVSHLLFQMGFTKEDKLIEVGGVDLMGSNESVSARKTAKAIQSAMNGCLFIDEAYGLTSDSAIAALVKAMTDNMDSLCVILAGYFLEMNDFLNLNSGLKSRIGTYINIQNYDEIELYKIFEFMTSRLGLRIVDSPELQAKLSPLIDFAIRTPNSGNGRYIERLVQALLLKISEEYFADPTRDISVIDADVIPEIADIIKTAA